MAAHRLRSGLFVAVAGCFLALCTTGEAAPKVPPQHRTIVQELHNTRMHLTKADHDYAGMRFRAIHQVNLAIHALSPGRSGAPKAPHAGKGRKRMPQAVSDQHMLQAVKQLHVILNQLGSLSGDGRTRKSMMHIRHAIRELHTALRIN